MFLVIVLFCLLCLLCSRPSICDNLSGDYVSRDRSSCINGIFIWIVFISHLNSYCQDWLVWDTYIVRGIGLIGQMCVATFFFYSGFGIMLSLQNKKKDYARALLFRRFPALLLHFAIAVCCFWCLQTAIGHKYDLITILLSLIGWESLGNSNWFIFITLSSYIIIALTYALFRRHGQKIFLFSLFVFFTLFSVLIRYKGVWWVNTIYCIPAGMAYAAYKNKFESLMPGSAKMRIIVSLFILAASLCIYQKGFLHWYISHNLASVAFAFAITLASSAIVFRRHSRFLCWCGGSGLFCLYIFQRIPMIVGGGLGAAPIVYQAICILCTLLIAYVASLVLKQMDRFVFKSKLTTK